jgi:16S rRNA (cytidine1402-2'-O)-methyltransferase
MPCGQLLLVATPIGNLDDLTPRAKSSLESADLVACEDTRVTGKLLHHIGISPPTLSYREENEKALAPQLADRIANGETIALVSDAGFPAISDPGFRLVRECRARNLPVQPIPGPMAGITALAASGLPTDSFLFVGFLPPKKSARQKFFETHKDLPHTIILYESRHRILKALDDLVGTLGPDRTICVAREITKLHETFNCGPAESVRSAVTQQSQKGEFVLLIAKEGYSLTSPPKE